MTILSRNSYNIGMDLVVAINKPKGPTSHDMINRVRRVLGIKKVGHAGTLDPLASGVLVVATGKMTKKLSEIMHREKEYLATITLGVNSSTDDEEGDKNYRQVSTPPSIDLIQKVLTEFVGIIDQTPPIYSAIKIKGRPAYDYARKNKEVILKSRKVEIRQIELIEYSYPELKILIKCGSGVYIRSLARDIGEKLETGAYMSQLCRTKVGELSLGRAIDGDEISLEKLKQFGMQETTES